LPLASGHVTWRHQRIFNNFRAETDRTELERFGPTRKGSDYIHSTNSTLLISFGTSCHHCNPWIKFLLQYRPGIRHPPPYRQLLVLTMKLSYFDLRRTLLDQLNWSKLHTDVSTRITEKHSFLTIDNDTFFIIWTHARRWSTIFIHLSYIC